MNHSSPLYLFRRVHDIGLVDNAFGLYLSQTIIFKTYYPVNQLTSTIKDSNHEPNNTSQDHIDNELE